MNAPDLPAQTIRLLVVDDDDVDRELITRLVPRTGLDAIVLEESDPLVALARLQHEPVDVILLDYEFPRHDGLVVLQGLRALDLLVPVIVLTGHDDTALAVDLMKGGAIDYIAKATLTAQRLGQSVRHALRLRASELAARAAHEALRASEEFSRRILESSHDCIKVLDLEGRLLSMNPHGRRALGIDAEDIRGRSWLELWSSQQRLAAEQAVAVAAAGGLGQFIGHCPSAGGAIRWWDVAITPVFDAEGRPERLVATSRDITERKQRTEFEQQLLGIVSHDLRNPLAAMVMGAAVLARKLPADSPLADIVARIERSGQRAARLIHDLLDLTQIRLGGALPIQRRRADLHAVCKQTVDELALGAPDRELRLLASGHGEGSWDADRLAQAVGNLVRNAITYGAPGTPITIRSLYLDGRAQIEVHNHGKPIPPDVVPTLFQPFKRSEHQYDPDRSIGLGLFIVREIVAAHGGAVAVRSTAVDGTTFVVDLPLE